MGRIFNTLLPTQAGADHNQAMQSRTEQREARRRQASEEASAWLEKLERALKRDEGASFQKWLKPQLHRDVIVERCRLWHGPEILAVLSELELVSSAPSTPDRRTERAVLATFFAVSGLGLYTALLALWSRTDGLRDARRVEKSYEVPIGAPRKIRFPDGSMMSFNGGTHVLVSFGTSSRDVTLLRGEALFDAARDPDRSFRVHAGARHFEVDQRGGEFNMRVLNRANTELTVLQGHVTALAARNRVPMTPAQIRAGFTDSDYTFNALEAGLIGPGWQSAWSLKPDDAHKIVAWSQP